MEGVRKLIHEDIDREVANKGVQIAIKVSKPVIDFLIKGLKTAVKNTASATGRAVINKIHPTKGKQSVKTLIRQGQGVSSIPLADEGLKDFQKIAKKYGVDFAIVKDKNVNPPVYTIFFKAKDMDAITRIIQDYSNKQIQRSSGERKSIIEKLNKFKEIVAKNPNKVVEKKKERVR